MRPVLAGLVLLLTLAACTATRPGPGEPRACLAIHRFPEQSPLLEVPLPPGGEFSLSFIHSVSNTPVRDDYQVREGRIVQTGEVFVTHGAGLPSGFADEGVVGWEHTDGAFIVHLHRVIDRLVVRTDRLYRNRLHSGEEEVNLNRWKDQALELSVVPCNRR